MRHPKPSHHDDTDINITPRILLIAVTAWCVLALMYLIRYWTLLELKVSSIIVVAIVITIILVISIVSNFSNKVFRQNVALSLFSIYFSLYAFGATHHYLNYYPGFPDLSPPIEITNELGQKPQGQTSTRPRTPSVAFLSSHGWSSQKHVHFSSRSGLFRISWWGMLGKNLNGSKYSRLFSIDVPNLSVTRKP